MPKYKFYYFNNNCYSTESIKLTLAQAGVEYEDVMILPEDWDDFKNKTPFGELPVLEVDGRPLAQNKAINRYLAKRFGFAGKSTWKAAQCDMVVDENAELVKKITPWVIETDLEVQEELWPRAQNYLKPFLAKHENILRENKSGYLVGKELSWADLQVYASLMMVLNLAPDFLQDHQELQQFLVTVASEPNVKKYLDSKKAENSQNEPQNPEVPAEPTVVIEDHS